MEMVKVTEGNVLSEIRRCVEAGLHRTLYMIVGEPMTFVHKERQVDTKTCDGLGYDVYEAYYNGGTIVGNAGDFAFAHFGDIRNDWMEHFIEYFIGWLKTRGLNAEYVDNDVLVDGYKVCGVCVTRYGRIDYTAGFVSLNANLDHIKAICKKPMKKVPRGLSDYGITTAEVERMFLDFCEAEQA